jgi:hypothetical protein
MQTFQQLNFSFSFNNRHQQTKWSTTKYCIVVIYIKSATTLNKDPFHPCSRWSAEQASHKLKIQRTATCREAPVIGDCGYPSCWSTIAIETSRSAQKESKYAETSRHSFLLCIDCAVAHRGRDRCIATCPPSGDVVVDLPTVVWKNANISNIKNTVKTSAWILKFKCRMWIKSQDRSVAERRVFIPWFESLGKFSSFYAFLACTGLYFFFFWKYLYVNANHALKWNRCNFFIADKCS